MFYGSVSFWIFMVMQAWDKVCNYHIFPYGFEGVFIPNNVSSPFPLPIIFGGKQKRPMYFFCEIWKYFLKLLQNIWIPIPWKYHVMYFPFSLSFNYARKREDIFYLGSLRIFIRCITLFPNLMRCTIKVFKS